MAEMSRSSDDELALLVCELEECNCDDAFSRTLVLSKANAQMELRVCDSSVTSAMEAWCQASWVDLKNRPGAPMLGLLLTMTAAATTAAATTPVVTATAGTTAAVTTAAATTAAVAAVAATTAAVRATVATTAAVTATAATTAAGTAIATSRAAGTSAAVTATVGTTAAVTTPAASGGKDNGCDDSCCDDSGSYDFCSLHDRIGLQSLRFR